MHEITEFLVNHGGPVLFGVVLLEQIGLPLPAAPWLVAAGALCADGRLNSLTVVLLTVLACLIADFIWFYLGRLRGDRVLNLLCRISLEPDSCVRRTQNVFTRYGMRGVLVAKFVPGVSTLAPPLAGMSGVSSGRFLLFDGAGSFLYVGAFILLGALFSSQLEQVLSALAGLGKGALGLVAALVAAYIGYKYYQRRRLLHELRVARITAEELRKKQEAGEPLLILDVRSTAELDRDRTMIQGALHITIDDVERRRHEFPADRDIVFYCACPNEVSAAKAAMVLHRKGFTRVRPLLGGINAWRERNYPLDAKIEVASSAGTTSANGKTTSQAA